MAIILSTTLSKIDSVLKDDNWNTIRDFYEYMKANGTSENHQNQNLNDFANFLGSETNYFEVKSKHR
jgi:hypothetical protein